MDKSHKSQIVKLSLITVLFLITPLLSTSMRPPYLYFLFNLLIIVLGSEAGLLSSSSYSNPPPKSIVVGAVVADASLDKGGATNTVAANDIPAESTEWRPKVVEKSASEKIVAVVKVHKVKKCPSMPSLFFIGGGEAEAEAIEEDEEEDEEMGSISGQELFTKAETFIGNFYKQLKMQREESWQKIHGFYQKAF